MEAPEEETEGTDTMTGQEEEDCVHMKTKAGLSDILGEVYTAVRESEWKNERAKNNNAYVPTMKEHVANIITHGVTHNIHLKRNSVYIIPGPGDPLTLAQLADDM